MADDINNDEKIEVIDPPSPSLLERVAPGPFRPIDMVSIKRAEQAISDMSDSYLDWVAEDLRKIQEAFDQMLEGSGDRAENMTQMFNITHDMKGQGSSFGYPLITAVGNKLCQTLEHFDGSVKPEVENETIRVHIDAMKLIISAKMMGDGGAEGNAILQGIEKVAEKVLPAK